jgi:carboxyl-terminal processing protease
MNSWTGRRILTLSFLCFAAGIVIGRVIFAPANLPSSPPPAELPEFFDLTRFNELYQYIREKYVGEVKGEKLFEGVLAGLVQGLGDPYSVYADAETTRRLQEDLTGKFSGVGIEIGMRQGMVTVIAPLPNSPAAAAGVKAGDVIIKVDDTEITPQMTLDEVVTLIRGPEGTKVVLTVLRENVQDVIEIPIVRQQIDVRSVNLRWEGNIAILSINVFAEDTEKEIAHAAAKIRSRYTRGIILDLRNNPGGVFSIAINVAGHFLPSGTPVVHEVAQNNKREIYHARGPGDLQNIPAVVLVNRGTASAAEILAGALRDQRKVKLVGERTFGKGSVQELKLLRAGASVRLTVARWETPAGHALSEQGLDPEIKIKDNPATPEDEVLAQAQAVLTSL